MDYRVYHCNKMDVLKWLGQSILITIVIAWLFYRSWYGMIFIFPVAFLVRKRYIKVCSKKRQQELLHQFKDAIQAVSAALLAGYSVENAFREAEKELQKLYGRDALMTREWHMINQKVAMNEPIEKKLMEFALRSGCEDVESFAEVFAFAKRSGGNFVKIIRTTISRMLGKIEVEREIDTVLAGKKLEGRIMNGMPVFILAYLRVTSGDSLQLLYGNVLGVVIMTSALVVYALALKLSDKILDIQI